MSQFDLTEISELIREQNYKNVALYFLEEFFHISSVICLDLKEKNNGVNFMIMITCSSGVDTMKWRLNSDSDSPDCVIYFGASCLCSSRYSTHLPTFFVPIEREQTVEKFIEEKLDNVLSKNSYKNILILSDLTYSKYLKYCDELSLNRKYNSSVEICKYSSFQQQNLKLLPTTCEEIVCSENESSIPVYNPFIFKQTVSDYDFIVFLGDCKNLELILNSKRILVMNPLKNDVQEYDGSKEFRKRVSLIEKFKNNSKMIGIVFINYTSSVTNIMEYSRRYCRRNKMAAFFLTLNQTDYELRLGNFTQLDGFVLVNVCDCNFDISSKTSKFYCPILLWKEFEIVSKKKIIYGGIQWNDDCDDFQEDCDADDDGDGDDGENRQLIERDILQKPKDAWYGLIVDAGNSQISDTIQPGLSGIASAYRTENDLF